MDYIAQSKDYWIHSNAISISLNALGDANRMQGSVASGASILCYIKNNAGQVLLDYNSGHQFQTWPLSLSPTYFNTDTPKYVYCAIPRTTAIGTTAVIVFPSELLDVYGINANGTQVGSEDYYYIFLQGVISAVLEEDGVWKRKWTQLIDTGSKGTDEALNDPVESDWYQYSKVSGIVTFLKQIVMDAGSWFQTLRLGNSNNVLTGVATSQTPDSFVDSDTMVATPGYLNANYLSKTHDDVAEGNIEFEKDITVDQNADIKGAANIGGDVSVGGNLGVKGWISAVMGIINTLKSTNYSGSGMTDTGFQLTNDDGNGNSQLVVDNIVARMKFIANVLEVRKYVSMGGNYVYSPAASVVEQVDYLDSNGNMLGYDTIKMPWLLRAIPLLARTNIFSTKRTVKRVGDVDMANVAKFRCWIKADDGTTKTINTWQTGMLARCQTMDLQKSDGGTHTDDTFSGATKNRLYWREVVGTGQGRLTLDDGYDHSYIDLSNVTGHFLADSDAPLIGDSVVCFGGTTTDLSNIIVIETVGTDAPALKEYLGVGLQHIGHDNTVNELPRFSMSDADGKDTLMTRISPKTGNRFVAPEFIIQTSNGNVNLKVALDGLESSVNSLKNGKNLLKGALTGDGWKSGIDYRSMTTDAEIDSDQWINVGTDSHTILKTPPFNIESGVVYMLSFDTESTSSVAVQIRRVSDDSVVGNTATDSGNTRHTAGFAPTYTGAVYILIQTAKLRYPQYEQGNQATAFDAGDTEVLSSIKQTADKITARVVTDEGYIAQLQIDTAGISSNVTALQNGKNLLPGVLTGENWKSAIYIVQQNRYTYSSITVEDGWFVKSNIAAFISSPVITVEAGKKYTFSFDVEGTVDVEVRVLKSASVYQSESKQSVSGRVSVTFTIAEEIAGDVRIFVNLNKIRYPQLEYGEEATAFDASSTETSSRILQTADNINLTVKNEFKAAGLDITADKVQLLGGLVEFMGGANNATKYIAVSLDSNNMPHFIFYAQDGVTPIYDLGYTGLTQLINNAVPDKYDGVIILAAISGGDIDPYESSGVADTINPKSLYNKEDTNNHDNLGEAAVWYFSEGYTLDGQGGKIWTHGGIYDKSYVLTRDYGDPLDDGWYFIFSEYIQSTGRNKYRVIHLTDGKIDAECVAYAEHWSNGSEVMASDVSGWKYRCWIVSSGTIISMGYTPENGEDSGSFYYMDLSPLENLL